MKEFGSNNLSFNGIKSISLDTCKQITNFRSFINATLPMLLQVCEDLVLIHLHPHILVRVPPLGLPQVLDKLQAFLPFPCHAVYLGGTQIVVEEQYIGVHTILGTLPRAEDCPASILFAEFL